jgi:hypothetical protein
MKPQPCTCILWPFPHRRTNECRVEEDGNDRDDKRELRDADNAERARDCRAEAARGSW